MQVFAPDAPAQKRPSVPLHPAMAPPQEAESCATAAMQVPGVEVAVSLPTQLSPFPQGVSSVQDAAAEPTGSHCSVEATQLCPWPQLLDAQESPALGATAQLPHSAFFVPEQ